MNLPRDFLMSRDDPTTIALRLAEQGYAVTSRRYGIV
jgi:hypothetical protein